MIGYDKGYRPSRASLGSYIILSILLGVTILFVFFASPHGCMG